MEYVAGCADSEVAPPPGYAALAGEAAWAEVADRSLLAVHGPDAADFLQRILTSDVAALTPGAGQWSGLLDGRGHWVSELLLYAAPTAPPLCDGGFLLDLPAERLRPVRDKLDLLHFAERLEVTPVGDGKERLLLAGPEAPALLRTLGLPHPDADDALGAARIEGGGLVLQRPDRGAPAWEVVVPALFRAELLNRLRTAGVAEASPEALEVTRIEAFQPKWGVDLTEEETLPVSDEWRRASLTKGCYPGQEVVARVHTYGEAPRRLVGLVADAPVADLAGAELRSPEGRRLGTVRSWTLSPRHGVGVGLGLVRRRAAADGFKLEAETADAKAEVSVRPIA